MTTKLNMTLFDDLFDAEPETKFLQPEKLVKQPTSRQIFKHGFRTHNVGYFASRINKALIPFESALERDACILFESYAELQSYKSQPCGIDLLFDNNIRTVYPDFELVLSDRIALIDIKFNKNITTKKFKQRCQALKQYAQQQGKKFRVLTEVEIRTTRKENAHYLLSLSRATPHPRLAQVTIKWLEKTLPLKFENLVLVSYEYPQVIATMAGLILDGFIKIDWDLPLSEQTLFMHIEGAH